ncbi:MAG: hypothetical protein A2580_18230 [Hydrogenophilales bacterium RIFOXYD1_FULL_62_11]|nr:MAG: hypothetical protein A2580_18230 [Hydrogenophilales bacterium RIFOXYD1_FULL_62_11]
MNHQEALVIGRLGSDARVGEPTEAGRRCVRFSIATNSKRSSAPEVTWHSISYWTGSGAELEFLRNTLVQGAVWLARGEIRARRVMHNDYPVEIERRWIEATKLELMQAASDSRGTESKMPEMDQGAEPDDQAGAEEPRTYPPAPRYDQPSRQQQRPPVKTHGPLPTKAAAPKPTRPVLPSMANGSQQSAQPQPQRPVMEF